MPLEGNYDFNLEKRRAAERLKELNARSKYKPAGQRGTAERAACAKDNGNPEGEKATDFLRSIGIPLLNDLKFDSDTLLIAGILLVLSAEKADKLLLLALLYILI